MNKQFSLQTVAANNKANIDTVWALVATSMKASERLLGLNMEYSHEALNLGGEYARQASAGGLDKLIPRQDSGIQKSVENATNYCRNVYNVCMDAQADSARIISARVEELSESMTEMLDTFAQSGPAGSENAIAAVKSAILNTSSAYSNLIKSAQQITEANQPEKIAKKAA